MNIHHMVIEYRSYRLSIYLFKRDIILSILENLFTTTRRVNLLKTLGNSFKKSIVVSVQGTAAISIVYNKPLVPPVSTWVC